MYGKSYDRKKQELSDHFQINSRIVDTKYDPGDPGQILSVLYKGEIITRTPKAETMKWKLKRVITLILLFRRNPEGM